MAMIFPVSIIELFLNYLSVYMRYRCAVSTILFSLAVISIKFGLQIKLVLMLKEHFRATDHLTENNEIGHWISYTIFNFHGWRKALQSRICFFLPKGLVAKSTINFMVPLATMYKFLHQPAVVILFVATNTKSRQYLKKQF